MPAAEKAKRAWWEWVRDLVTVGVGVASLFVFFGGRLDSYASGQNNTVQFTGLASRVPTIESKVLTLENQVENLRGNTATRMDNADRFRDQQLQGITGRVQAVETSQNNSAQFDAQTSVNLARITAQLDALSAKIDDVRRRLDRAQYQSLPTPGHTEPEEGRWLIPRHSNRASIWSIGDYGS